MKLAQVEAQKLNHPAIDTVHVFLGLLSEGSGVAANVLKNLEVDLESARRQVQASSVPGGPSASVAPNSLTPDTLVVMDFAREEARTLNHNYVGTEHLLLGLLRAIDGVTVKVLAASNVTADSVRAEVLNLLGHSL